MAESTDRARDEFLSEAQEIVEGLGRDLLAIDEGLRAGRVDPSLVNDVFRAVHTLKGLAGLFGATRMASLSHELEDLLDRLRLGRTDLTAAVLDLLFRSVELYGRILQAEKEGREGSIPEVEELVRDLHKGLGGPPSPSPGGQYELDPSLLAVLTEYEEHRLRTNIAQGLRLYRLRVQFQLATIDQALDDLKSAAKPHGEIITYLPTGAGADADSIELDILMASAVVLSELTAALGGRAPPVRGRSVVHHGADPCAQHPATRRIGPLDDAAVAQGDLRAPTRVACEPGAAEQQPEIAAGSRHDPLRRADGARRHPQARSADEHRRRAVDRAHLARAPRRSAARAARRA
jgi:chemotaxis protein histidine kinase CheA